MIGSLFSGYGGLDMAAADVFGMPVAWHCEIEAAPSRILTHHWPGVPNLGDITKADWTQVEPVDVLTGGFPCQDVSHAGKRLGMHPDTRSGLWTHMAYAIAVLRPAYVVAENVRGLLSAEAAGDLELCPWCVGDGAGRPMRALGAVLGDLAELGYDACWSGVRAADVGAPHGRFRIFVVARDTARRWDAQWRLRDAGGGRRDEGAPGAAGRVPAAERSDASVADTGGQRHGGGQDPRGVGRVDGADAAGARERQRAREVAGDRGTATAADAGGDGLQGVRRLDTLRRDADGRHRQDIAWGQYEPAIRRWEHILGRLAPPPTEPGRNGQPRLSPRFVEWMMGLPDGWVTAVPGISRNDQLKALGNGVVLQQARYAVRLALAHLAAAERAA